MKGITLKICRLYVCVTINKCSFESFTCLDFVFLHMIRRQSMHSPAHQSLAMVQPYLSGH